MPQIRLPLLPEQSDHVLARVPSYRTICRAEAQIARDSRFIRPSHLPYIHSFRIMSWFSILPSSIAFIEIWIVRFFVSLIDGLKNNYSSEGTWTDSYFQLVLGLITIGPWFLLIIYDMFLYVFRTATYELPYVGGRARNRPRPRAPSLSQRPSGRPRAFSSLTIPGTAVEIIEEGVDGLKQRLEPSYERDNSAVYGEDE